MQKGSSSRIRAPGNWSFVIGSEFQLHYNGDSVQAVHCSRIVYISSLHINSIEKSTNADQLRTFISKRFGSKDLVSHFGQTVQGDAEIIPNGNRWCLQGVMCVDGAIAACIINFESTDDREWAIKVWKSLSYELNDP